MFENHTSLATSGSGRGAAMRLEALEDRTTPAVVAPAANQFGAFGVNTAALSGITLAANATVDRAFLSEVARVSVMQWFLATTEANQGADPQIRAFASQFATSQLNLFNSVLPVLQRSGVPLQLNAIDQALIDALPGVSGTSLDSQFLFFNSLYGLQSAGLAQTAANFGTSAAVRSFALSQFSPLQSQLQTGFGFLGTDLSNSTFNLFSTFNGVGPFGTTLGVNNGFGTTGFGTTGLGTTGFGNTGFAGVAPVNAGFGTASTGTFGSTPATGTFGSTATTSFNSTATNSFNGSGTFGSPGTGTFGTTTNSTFGSPNTFDSFSMNPIVV